MQAYNDWHVEEWCGAYPARFIPMTLPVIWDAEACAKEIRRNATRGVHSLTFTENPAAMGYPSFHDFDYWTPMWEALVDTDTVLNVHIGSSGRLAITAPDAPMDVMITLQPMNIVQAAADLLWSKPIKKYPDLKIALSEGGTGWIPYFLERADRTYEMHSTWTGQDFGKQKPSEVFRDHFLTLLHRRSVGVQLRNEIGIDNICWEADYPHSDSMWPGAPEQLDEVLKDQQRARRRDQQDDLRERHALVPLGPVHPHHQGTGHRRRTAQSRRGSRRLDPGAVARRRRPARPSPTSRPAPRN